MTRTLLILYALGITLCAAVSGKPKPPNILFIFADDWGWGDLSCHGHPYVKTPNIDRLAREGTDFYRFTVASGVCSPSRTAVMTGHFPARYNINGHFAWVPSNAKRGMPDWLDPKAPLLSRFLQGASYSTAHYGKWHLANDMIPDSPPPGAYGFDAYGAFNCSGKQMPVHEDAKNTIAFIEKSHQADKPFYINLWLHEPHTPFHTLPKYRKRFPKLEERDNIYASVLSHADDRVGEVLNALDRLKITDTTLVIFSSDNGPARMTRKVALKRMHDTATGEGFNIAAAKGITGGRKGYKASLFEGGIGVPFIARWPGKIAAGKVDKTSIFSAVDLLPTFCEIAGVKLPADYKPDGISQVATLKGKGQPLREKPLFWKTLSTRPVTRLMPSHWGAYVVVHNNWKLVTDQSVEHVELYDLVKDPLEKSNLAKKHPGEVTLLKKMLTEWQATLPAKPTGKVFSSLRKS
jgi:arylsulfatase A-like enzyme